MNRSSTNFTAILALPCCRLGVRMDAAGNIDEVVFLAPDTPLHMPTANSQLIESFQQDLAAWLENPAHEFKQSRTRRGTPFQQRIWQAISGIPLGEIRTYGELSADTGGTARAVGQACGANPLPIIVPCHRVVAKTGMGGFANARDGWLLDTKRWLLKHEGVL